MDVNRLVKAAVDLKLGLPDNLIAGRWYFLILVALAAASLPKLFTRGLESGHTIGSYSWLWVTLLSVAVILTQIEVIILALLWTGFSKRMARFAGSLSQRLSKLGWLNGVGIFALWGIYVLIILWRYQKHFADFAPQVWVFWLLTGAGALLLVSWKKMPFAAALPLVMVFYAAGVKALGYLPEISSFPFSLSWSEASRYYYASLPYSKALYGFQIPLSSLHPTRYLLQSVAFWVPGSEIWLHRFWQVLLWLSLSLLTGLVFARRFLLQRTAGLAVALWAALFTLQGPVYYHLLVCAILVLYGFDRNRFWKTMVFIILASAWAGISRVNWIPVPAMLAAALYLVEKPVCADAVPGQGWVKNWSRYLGPVVAWGLAGVLAALAAQGGYILVSGHESAGSFGTSFTSALLWKRLFTSPTFPLGVLPATLLVSAPLLALIGGNWWRSRAAWHPLRILGLSGMAFVLFAGGLVVSAKIGGGSNIHNMDAYLVLLMVIGASIGLNGYAAETGARPIAWRPWLLLLAIVLVPVIWNLDVGDPFVERNFEQASYDLNKLNEQVQKHVPEGEVLFITQRQLIVFNQIPGVPMVPDYELMTLMEMAMAGNRPYLDQFQQDLINHRFALIVTDRQHLDIVDPDMYSFAEENNAWVENVSKPIFTYYQEETYFDTRGIQLFVPRK